MGQSRLDGVVPFAPSYDTVGWFARDAETLAHVGDVLLPPQEHPPITNLTLADDAFGLVDPLLAAELKTRAAGFGPTGSVGVFDGKEADYFECYRVLQGAEIWQSLGTWITRHKPRCADDIAAAICQHRGDHGRRRRALCTDPRRDPEQNSKSLSRRTPQLSCR